MGVPAFFRWLSKKYPCIVVQCDEGVVGQYHMDNLYLDMNGIIHPCSHPEHKAPPENEQEMFIAIFEYIERIMRIVRPQKLVYMAIDGVAPRAKMNQQRSRRFRASQESYEKIIEVEKVKTQLREKGIEVKDKPKEAHFDSNVITPGTEFMINLSEALREWINNKLSAENHDTDGIWPNGMMVILSDASVPGEGEHKIMEYIRKQKGKTDTYDPDLSHCMYGADADLIMLGLATHELNFTIIREEFRPNMPKPCDICGQLGHLMTDCLGTERPVDEDDVLVPLEPEFIYIRLNVLREYLERECDFEGTHLNLEKFIDDFVFLCFFVGNDFLPHLPSLEIRENAIDRLINLYKEITVKFPDSNIYLTEHGLVNLARVQLLLKELGENEDEIFKKRQDNERRFKERKRQQKMQDMQMNFNLPWLKPEAVSDAQKPKVFDNTRLEAYKVRMDNSQDNSQDNLTAAQKLKAMLLDDSEPLTTKDGDDQSQDKGMKRKCGDDYSSPNKKKDPLDSDEEPEDNVQLWNDGWKQRYYNYKFDCSGANDISGVVAREYIIGLCWVLRYYYQGCADWKWFYPFHYAPFASDFADIENIIIEFDRESQPFKPLEQLMSVFPAASSQNLPLTWRNLMTDSNSSIIDFYPNTFKIDLNGKRFAWMGVALLPFIDECRLFDALKNVYPDLTESEINRNSRGTDLIFVSRCNNDPSNFSKEIVDSAQDSDVLINPLVFNGIAGTLKKSTKFSDKYNDTYCLIYKDPEYSKNHIFAAIRLKNAKSPPKVLKPEDFDDSRGQWRPTIGMSQRNDRAFVSDGGRRMLRHSIPNNANRYDNSNWNYNNRNNSFRQSFQAQNQYQPQQYRPFYGAPQSYQQNQGNPRNSAPHKDRHNYGQY